jgi:hypothetical protein
MRDALSRNVPKLPNGVEILVANCLARGRRQFVEVVQNFPEECWHVLEMLGEVYRYDAQARDGALTAEERLRFHQEDSGPVSEKLHGWLEARFAQPEDRAQLRYGQGDHISVAALEGLDDVSPKGRKYWYSMNSDSGSVLSARPSSGTRRSLNH